MDWGRVHPDLSHRGHPRRAWVEQGTHDVGGVREFHRWWVGGRLDVSSDPSGAPIRKRSSVL